MATAARVFVTFPSLSVLWRNYILQVCGSIISNTSSYEWCVTSLSLLFLSLSLSISISLLFLSLSLSYSLSLSLPLSHSLLDPSLSSSSFLSLLSSLLFFLRLQEMKTGLSENSVLSVYHPDAMDLFNVCSSLEKVTSHTHTHTRHAPQIFDVPMMFYKHYGDVYVALLISGQRK